MKIIELTATQTWPIRHQVMWPDKPLEYVKLPNDAIGNHFGLMVAGNLVSIISLFERDNEIQFRKFATLKQEQGKGYGSFLLSNVLKDNISLSTKTIWCNARTDKSTFYQKFGLQPTKDTFNKGGIDYVIMKKIISSQNEN